MTAPRDFLRISVRSAEQVSARAALKGFPKEQAKTEGRKEAGRLPLSSFFV
jgi:hypothetical protein